MLGSLISGGLGLLGGLFSSNKEAKRQKLFAQTGIQWKVNDSIQAGIHPLFGLGANTAQYSPTNIVGDNIARAGQDIGGAVDRMRTTDQRSTSYNSKLMALQIRRGELENLLLESQIARAAQTPTPAPPAINGDYQIIPGQGDTRAPRPPIKAFGVTIKPRQSETPATVGEDEYGDENFMQNLVNNVRYVRDAQGPAEEAAKNYLWQQWEKVKRNEPNDLFYAKGFGPGQTLKRKGKYKKLYYDRVPMRLP